MAAGDLLVTVGTAKTWTSSGGDYAITMSSITADSWRQGVKGDLGATRAPAYSCMFQIKTNTAPTVGNTYDFYWAASTSATAGTDNPGNTTGTDIAYTGYTTGTAEEAAKQLMYVGSLVVSDETTTTQVTYATMSPPTRYGQWVFHNNTDQTTGTTGTDHKIVMTPIIPQVQS